MVEVMSHEVDSYSVNYGDSLASAVNDDLEALPPHSLTIDFVSISDDETGHLSFMVGGTAARVIPYTERTTFGREIGGAIMHWGDYRLGHLLEAVTEASGYDYGAERLHLVTLTDSQAALFNVVPKVPLDPDIILDDDGQIVEELVYLAIPEKNPNIEFYTWDEVGQRNLEQRLQAGNPFAWPWVDCGKYWLAFSIATNYKDVILMDHATTPQLTD